MTVRVLHKQHAPFGKGVPDALFESLKHTGRPRLANGREVCQCTPRFDFQGVGAAFTSSEVSRQAVTVGTSDVEQWLILLQGLKQLGELFR